MPQLQDGRSIPSDFGAGMGFDDELTLSSQFAMYGEGTEAVAMPATAGAGAVMASPKVSSLWYLVGVALIIVMFKFAVEQGEHHEFSFMGISVYNFVASGAMALLFIAMIKIIVNKYHVPGLTDLINIV